MEKLRFLLSHKRQEARSTIKATIYGGRNKGREVSINIVRLLRELRS